ncbi:MAG: TatD family hydrolase [[Clostridium] fimetarium]|nr:TatD family hydrolase [Alistipes timonensis]MCM1406095.1 TatD family hydrolase [[Clostridium] fimetarium]
MLVDTHTHIYMPEFTDPAAEVRAALEAGVGKLVLPGTEPSDFEARKKLAAEFPGQVFLGAGVHPTEMGPDPMADVAAVEEELRANPGAYVAVGEVGIDLYWDTSRREEQLRVFRRQCELALELDLPVIIHCREGLDDVLAVLGALPEVPRCVFHSFTGTPEEVARVRLTAPDAYFGINGIVTFKNAKVRETLPHIGLDRMLLETDSPWLAPVPHRGKRNTSAYIPHIARHIADSMGLPLETVENATTRNSSALFGI